MAAFAIFWFSAATSPRLLAVTIRVLVDTFAMPRNTESLSNLRSGLRRAGSAPTVTAALPMIQSELQRFQNHAHIIPARYAKLTTSDSSTANPSVETGIEADFATKQVIRVYANSPAQVGGVREGDTVLSVNGAPPRAAGLLIALWGDSLSLELESPDSEKRQVRLVRGHFLRRLEPVFKTIDDCGIIELPSSPLPFLAKTDSFFSDLSQHGRGLVVDVRRSEGGSTAPLVEAVLPVLDEQRLGMMRYRFGTLRNGFSGGLHQQYRIDLPVAILTSHLTASAAEYLVIALRGLPETRIFGERTAGFTTANMGFALPGGHRLAIPVAVEQDFSGIEYPSGVVPDVEIQQDWAYLQSGRDRTMEAALEWLQAKK